MSDDVERPLSEPPPQSAPDPDAWATACEEDLTAEKARRRAQYGPPPTSAAEELRRLADAVTEKVAGLSKPLGGALGGAMGSAAAQGVAEQFIAQARATIEPVVARNPQFFDHLAAAGNELLAAYRSAVQDAERRWTSGESGSGDASDPRDEHVTLDETSDEPDGAEGTEDGRGASGKRLDERVELDRTDDEPGASDDPRGDAL